MANVSPYQRSGSERGRHWLSTTAFLVIAAVVFVVVGWIAKPKPEPPKPIVPGGRGETTIVENSVEPVDNEAKNWVPRIAAITKSLPRGEASEAMKIRQRLDSVAQVLDSAELSPDAEAEIQTLLDEFAEEAKRLNAMLEPPSINANGIDEAISSEAQSRRMAEVEAIRQASLQAERTVRQAREPTIRQIRLGLREQQDRAKRLRLEIERTQREQAKFKAKKLRAEALSREMTDVNKYLSPFISPGYLQPNSDRNAWVTERTVEAKPVSLSRLKKLGALENTMKGIELLYMFGGGKNPIHNNSRPLGAFPQYAAQRLRKPEIIQPLERAQELLRDHGQALVEEQLLSP